MLFPIGDDQVKGGHFPLFSYGFILLNLGIYLIQIQFSDELICSFGTIPSNIASGRDFYTLVTSMFLHGG
ncbi:MAG: rhomboid family intramembrane serine protease, partial [Saprospiraceae bacterium]|nr:rhomboid family intramembrane serine protease [Saprospiraceae bacterium]